MKKVKKVLLTLGMTAACLIPSSVTQAIAPENSFNGYYVGATTGFDSQSVRTQLTDTAGESKSDRKTNSGILYGLYTGYGYAVNCFYIGGELTIGGTTANKSHTYEFNGGETASKYTKGLFVQVGPRVGAVFAKGVLGYVKLGLEWSRDKVRFSDDTGEGGSKSSNKYCFVPGVGIEKVFGGKWIARLEYTYLFGPGGITATNENVGDVSGKRKNGNRVLVGLAYKF